MPRQISVSGSDGVVTGSEKRAATQDVHDILRRQILDGQLAPGSEISQLELSRRLSVSRTPLREALRLLEREGLVLNNGPHRLVRISPLTMSDLDDLYSLRVMGEALAIWETVPTLREGDFVILERNLATTTSATDLNVAEEAHRAFHAGLRTGSGLRLRNHLAMLFEHAERYLRAILQYDSQLIEQKHQEHHDILDACRARDRNSARALIVDHIATTAMALMEAESHAPFSLPLAVRMATEGRSR